jgi:hypothetical protein
LGGGGKRTLKLDLVLYNKTLALGVDLLREDGGNGVVSGRVFHNETFVTIQTLEDDGFLDSPLANIGPFFLGTLHVFLGVRGLPSFLPVICELLKEFSLEVGRLSYTKSRLAGARHHGRS